MKKILLLMIIIVVLLSSNPCYSIRFPNPISQVTGLLPSTTKTAVFALGSFWRSESVFGCLDGVVRTTVGYTGGSKLNPEYRSLGDHAESIL
ncbi:peptide methionine sulfoxide reductase A5, partial [Tanacetum coccineum]